MLSEYQPIFFQGSSSNANREFDLVWGSEEEDDRPEDWNLFAYPHVAAIVSTTSVAANVRYVAIQIPEQVIPVSPSQYTSEERRHFYENYCQDYHDKEQSFGPPFLYRFQDYLAGFTLLKRLILTVPDSAWGMASEEETQSTEEDLKRCIRETNRKLGARGKLAHVKTQDPDFMSFREGWIWLARKEDILRSWITLKNPELITYPLQQHLA